MYGFTLWYPSGNGIPVIPAPLLGKVSVSRRPAGDDVDDARTRYSVREYLLCILNEEWHHALMPSAT
jgi:hypothetical protein